MVLTAPLSSYLEELRALRIFSVVGGWNAEVLFADRKEVVSLHIHDLLSATHREYLAMHLEDGSAIEGLDAEVVSRDGEHLLLQNQGFRLASDEVGEDANLCRRRRQLSALDIGGLDGGFVEHDCCYNTS